MQERKSVANAGLNVKRLTGEDIKPEHWDAFYLAYINTTGALLSAICFACHPDQQHCVFTHISVTSMSLQCEMWNLYCFCDSALTLTLLHHFCSHGCMVSCKNKSCSQPYTSSVSYQSDLLPADRKWGQAYLTQDFFPCLGKAMADKVLLVMAEDASTNKPVAAALNLIGSDALFGRNWGCMYGSSIKHLHFELCYYQVCSRFLADTTQNASNQTALRFRQAGACLSICL